MLAHTNILLFILATLASCPDPKQQNVVQHDHASVHESKKPERLLIKNHAYIIIIYTPLKLVVDQDVLLHYLPSYSSSITTGV